jgi:hypothetical protein
MSSVDRKKLEQLADNILAKDPKTKAEIASKRKRHRATEARYAQIVSRRRKPNLLTEAMKDSCEAHGDHDT